MAFPGRRLGSKTHRKSYADQESLLVNPTTNSATSTEGKRQLGYRRNTTGGSSVYSGSSSGGDSSGSHLNRPNNNNSRLAPEHRFLPQHNPRGSPTAPFDEIPPAEGVLQFVPAYDESSGTPADTSWDAILQDDPQHHQQHSMNGLGSAKTSVGSYGSPRQKSLHPYEQQYQPRPHYQQQQQQVQSSIPINSRSTAAPINPKRTEAESVVSTSQSSSANNKSKGPRIARLAALFSSKSTGGGHSPLKEQEELPQGHNKSTSYSTTNTTALSSPSRSSSSGGYIGWPGTQDKRGDTVALNQSSYEDSDVGAVRREIYRDYDDDEDVGHPHAPGIVGPAAAEAAWMNNSIFQDISGVAPDDSGFLGGETGDDFQIAEALRVVPPPPPPPPRGGSYNHAHGHAHQQPLRSTQQIFPNAARWGGDGDTPSNSSPSRSSVSKNSSAYFDADVRPMAFPAFIDPEEARVQVAASVMRGTSKKPQPPTEETLAANNRLTPPHRTPPNARGYRGLIDKTHEVPNLMDDADSDSMASSSRASSAVVSTASGPAGGYHHHNNRQPYHGGGMPSVHEEAVSRDSESDVFDEISKYSLGNSGLESEVFEGIVASNGGEEAKVMYEMKTTVTHATTAKKHAKETKQSSSSKAGVKLVLLGGGLTALQTTTTDFSNRKTASDFDETLSNSDVDQFGFAKLPSFQEMAAAGRSVNDSASVIDASIAVDSSYDSRSVRSERDMSHDVYRKSVAFGAGGEPEISRLNTSAFSAEKTDKSYRDDESAFFSDFYSGEGSDASGELSAYYIQPHVVKRLVRKYRKLSRQSAAGCRTYEEIDRAEDEKKVFALFEMRSRIMEKDIERGLERRGGTSVVDDLILTPYFQSALQIRDAVIVSKAWRDGATPMDVVNTAGLTRRTERSYLIKRPVSPNELRRHSRMDPVAQYRWEEVTWVDDTDFSLYRCPSLGPRNLRGFEMFTIGDCQSILLKLTNERCMELRAELNAATARQIEAEELMKEEGDFGHSGIMTDAELLYLSSMEEVKDISRKLVVAEKAFALVRDRIRNLVSKYEALLAKMSPEGFATSSVVTYGGSSSYSYESTTSSELNDMEEKVWARRMKRAEVEAELNAREALFAKQTANIPPEAKQRELDTLQRRLAELQSEASTAASDRQRSAILAKAISARSVVGGRDSPEGDQPKASQANIEGVKQRFRDRMAAKLRDSKRESPTAAGGSQSDKPAMKTFDAERQRTLRLAGQEMFQQLDFYERVLSVEKR